MSPEAFIAAQARLRRVVVEALTRLWLSLAGYDRADVPGWLDRAVPIAQAAQRQSVALTYAYIGRALERQPEGVDPDPIIRGIRSGVTPEDVYTRPFVTLWSALKEGRDFEQARAEGLDRATSAAATDTQLAMTHTLKAAAEADDLIVGFARVPDAGACDFCLAAAGQRYTKHDLMPLHNHCGCGVDVITKANRHEFTGNPGNDLHITEGDLVVAIRDHGELGPVLTDASQHFTPNPA